MSGVLGTWIISGCASTPQVHEPVVHEPMAHDAVLRELRCVESQMKLCMSGGSGKVNPPSLCHLPYDYDCDMDVDLCNFAEWSNRISQGGH